MYTIIVSDIKSESGAKIAYLFITQLFQNKILRTIMGAPWYVPASQFR